MSRAVPAEVRFFEKFIPEPNSGCWLWEAAINACGYGTIGVKGRSMLAHRLSYKIYYGKLPKNKNILHRCDVPCCVNPEHLFAGTQRENIYDMEVKDRAYHPTGEQHGRAKLTEDDVRRIRLDPRSSRKIAPEYGVDRVTIQGARNGRTWGHVK